MKKRKDECLFCKKRKCYERVVTSDDMGESFDEVACPSHVKDLHRYSDEVLPGVMKIFSSSTGKQTRGDHQIFKGVDWMETMKKVTRYQCQFCKKDFKTPDKHHCKFNPELKNCFTCKHLRDWLQSEEHYDYGTGYGLEPNYPDCVAISTDMQDWNIELIKEVNYNMQCSQWEEGQYDWEKEHEDELFL